MPSAIEKLSGMMMMVKKAAIASAGSFQSINFTPLIGFDLEDIESTFQVSPNF